METMTGANHWVLSSTTLNTPNTPSLIKYNRSFITRAFPQSRRRSPAKLTSVTCGLLTPIPTTRGAVLSHIGFIGQALRGGPCAVTEVPTPRRSHPIWTSDRNIDWQIIWCCAWRSTQTAPHIRDGAAALPKTCHTLPCAVSSGQRLVLAPMPHGNNAAQRTHCRIHMNMALALYVRAQNGRISIHGTVCQLIHHNNVTAL
ncbi:hypothetical protein HBI56_027150 [Parastagonospora nodorum]|uniref:Uncharacterized protein n=1 Tax=Phaeosphaeria nodorum (strain SN15 / ATCC MYA-4574 / FGSC 10173) TaxID=321614 RepID=A0A7U2EXU8_PHANO|nr:hypothetical protein HBH56_014800 [Parastagonospora nodorum]QRC94967.1 hypothetical protein JI435_406630 [Parastagonospora nodorum SN15]KAH3937283.1 hypothetical protein HBH54_019640 [Parastagonospora nodorum]KAH4006433.1 hypothetical protein HBI10_019470 [Parastagonospora nodorum]KAH4015304.1 hypothetical protein HBI13_161170 [Parastagonospora nodorum]